jgi:hypothetical protein
VMFLENIRHLAAAASLLGAFKKSEAIRTRLKSVPKRTRPVLGTVITS